MIFSRIAEEIAPILFFYCRAPRLLRRADEPEILKTPSYANYLNLSSDKLSQRLTEERQRGAALDEKTFKLTLSLAIGLTVLGTGVSGLVKDMPVAGGRVIVAAGLAISIFFILGGGFLALGSMRSVRSYGYGTAMLLVDNEKMHEALADALARQEIVNNIRTLRNEAAYQMLRNGFVILLTTLTVFASLLAFDCWLKD
jgi:hypothetical protein